MWITYFKCLIDQLGNISNFYILCVLICCLVQLKADVREAFDVAYDNIYAFHVAQKPVERSVENMKVSTHRYAGPLISKTFF